MRVLKVIDAPWFKIIDGTGPFSTASADTDWEFSANFDRQASATDSVLFLGRSQPKANKTVSFIVSFHRRATPSGILFLVSIERGDSRRVYDRGPLLSDVRQLGDAPWRCLARPGGSAWVSSDRRALPPGRARHRHGAFPSWLTSDSKGPRS